MVDVNDSSSSALDLIKRFADDWMQVSDAIDCEDLTALVDALDRLKKDAKKKLSIKKAMQASMKSDWQPTHTGSAGQGIRRSHRIASAPRSKNHPPLRSIQQDLSLTGKMSVQRYSQCKFATERQTPKPIKHLVPTLSIKQRRI
ncbi:hypothetical protein EJ07DRAFT_180414 [Lizonia empirigonia]|nr:hypothetical protein EJ07DRAFT_180414 [Lizonia empirigonia]